MAQRHMHMVASYPKSGTTWFSFLMYVCRHGTAERSADVLRYYPDVLVPQQLYLVEEKLDIEEDFFVKSHSAYFAGTPYKDHIKQCIYLVRNPFDIMLSQVNNFILDGVKEAQSEKGVRRFYEQFIRQANKKPFEIRGQHIPVGGWNNHVVSWLRLNEDVPTYMIRYEDLRADTFGVISNLNEALQFGFREEDIRMGCRLSSFEIMKKLEAHELVHEIPGMFYSEQRKKAFLEEGVQFVNKGHINAYKDVLDNELIEEGKSAFHEGMRLAGYLPDTDPDNTAPLP